MLRYDVAVTSGSIDVLVVAALKEELDALLQVRDGVRGAWTRVEGDPPLHVVVLEGAKGPIRVVAARQTKMTGMTTASLASRLIERLQPKCLAMCGVCAGHPEDTDLGDVVIAERLFLHDEGKNRHDGFQGDLWVDALRADWLHVAQDMEGPGTLFSMYRPPDGEDWKWWFLERLSAGRSPLQSCALRRYVPDNLRSERFQALRSEQLVTWKGKNIELTEAGSQAVEENQLLHGTLVRSLPFYVHVGPMGSGNAVQASGTIWGGVANGGECKTLAVEMEAAAIGRVAHEHRLPWAVAKGVMDHGDSHKSDRFKGFAARASAEVLCRFLRKVVPSQGEIQGESKSAFFGADLPAVYERVGEALAMAFETQSQARQDLPSASRGEPPPPKVFVCYSRESAEHDDLVLALADKLRSEGVDAWIDRYVTSPPEGWPAWIRNQVVHADFVLLVCSAQFRRRFEGNFPGKTDHAHRAVAWEGLLASQLVYGDREQNARFIPVLLPGGTVQDIPVELRSSTLYGLPEQYEELYRRLVGEVKGPPPLGGRRPPTIAQQAVSQGAPLEFMGRVAVPKVALATGRELAKAVRALSEFLNDKFGSEELRRLAFFHGGPELDGELPGSSASRSVVAFELVQSIVRRNLLDEDFFADLTRNREGWTGEIAKIRQQFFVPATSGEIAQSDTVNASGSTPSVGAPVAAVHDDTSAQGGDVARPGVVVPVGEAPVVGSAALESQKPNPQIAPPLVKDDTTWSAEGRGEIEVRLLRVLRDAPKLATALADSLTKRGYKHEGPVSDPLIERVVGQIVSVGRGVKAAQCLGDVCCDAVFGRRAPVPDEAATARKLVEEWLPLGFGNEGRVVELTLRIDTPTKIAQSTTAQVKMDTTSPIVVEIHVARLDAREASFATRSVDVDRKRTEIVEGRGRLPTRMSGPEILNDEEIARTIVRMVSRRFSLDAKTDEPMRLIQVLAELDETMKRDGLLHYVVFTGKESGESQFIGVVEYLHKVFNENEDFGEKGLFLRIVAMAPEPGVGEKIPAHLVAEERLLGTLRRLLRGPVEDEHEGS